MEGEHLMAKTYDPTTFTTAKGIIFRRLVASIAGALTTKADWLAKDGQNSFNGFLPPIFNAWGITFGGGGDVRQTWNSIPWEMHVNADIEGVFQDQEVADEVGMRLIEGLGAGMRWIDDDGDQVTQADPHRVQAFRIRSGGNLDVYLGPRNIANEGAKNPKTGERDPINVWILKIGCELVFNTWTDVEEE
jgi:hypothetical protein